MNIEDTGNYVINFRSFVPDMGGHGREKSDVVTIPRKIISNSLRPEQTPLITYTPDETKWDQNADSLGREIFSDGDKTIRMPQYEIKFTVVAGPPQKFEIEEFGNENFIMGQNNAQ